MTTTMSIKLDNYTPLIYKILYTHKLLPRFQEFEDDFIQEGYLALLGAVSTFNPEKGTKFSTYAYTCIRNGLYKFVRSQKMYAHEFYDIPFEDKYLVTESEAEEMIFLDHFHESLMEFPHREVVEKHIYQNKTQTQIASELSITQQRVSQILQEFKKQVNEKWN